MSQPQPKDLLFRAGGQTLERYGVPVWRRAPIARGGEEWKETFTRADGATPVTALLGRDGLYHLVQQNQLRVEYVPNVDVGDGLGPRTRATLLLEGGRINRLPHPLNLGAWSTSGAPPAAVGGQADPFGGTGAWLLNDNSGAATQVYFDIAAGLVGDGTKAMALFLKQGTAAVTTVDLFDSTAAVKRVRIDVTWNGVNAPTLTIPEGAGQTWTPTPVPGAPGWWRIPFNGQGLLAANVNNYRILPAGNTPANTGTVIAYCAQLEDALFPSSPLPTTIARATEALTVPIGFGVRDLTILVRLLRPLWADVAVALPADNVLFALGNSAPGMIYARGLAATRTIRGAENLTGTPAAVDAALPAGAVLTVLMQAKNLLTLNPSVAIDVGGGLSAFVSNAQASIARAFAQAVVGIGTGGGFDPAYANLLDVIGFDGLFSLADCLSIP